MTEHPSNEMPAMQLLERMFDVEMQFIRHGSNDVGILGQAFHHEVVVHEPASLPYAGDWSGWQGIGALFARMRRTWSDMKVEDIEAVRMDDLVFMTCKLHMTCRTSAETISQPFAEVLRFKDGLLIEGTPFYFDTSEIVAALSRGSLADQP
jgi:hypothetical protein